MKRQKSVKKIIMEWISAVLMGVGVMAFLLISPIISIYVTSFIHLGGTTIDLIITIILNIFLISIPTYFSIKNYIKKKNSPALFLLVINCLLIFVIFFEWIFVSNLINKFG